MKSIDDKILEKIKKTEGVRYFTRKISCLSVRTRPRKRFGFLSPKQVYLKTINNNGKLLL